MPNEKIHRTVNATVCMTAEDAARGVDTGDVTYRECLTVSWHPDQDVTVGVEYEPLQGLTGETERGAAMTLDRAELNRLIKALRRARDSAYGRDE